MQPRPRPYFNLQGPVHGAIVVIGWPGQWVVEFERTPDENVRVRAGQKTTDFSLLPGEEVRTPLIVLQFYAVKDPSKGPSGLPRAVIRAQNIWRQWMLRYNVPRPGGELPPPHFRLGTFGIHEYVNVTEENQVYFIDRAVAEGLTPDYWHMDAGWYDCSGHWPFFGSWIPDPKRFPKGLRPVSDAGRRHNIKLLLWLVPELAYDGSYLRENYPDWFHGSQLKLGDPAVSRAITEWIDREIIKKHSVDCYRQDFAGGPPPDEPGRVGLNENKYVVGQLAFYDGLLERHPDLLIDMCSGGGRRNDLEAMRRAIPLWISDNIGHTVGMQGKTYGLSFWLPCFGSMVGATTDEFRSRMTGYILAEIDFRQKGDYSQWRRWVAQWRSVSHYYLGDYYPLTPYSLNDTDWMAWQFDRPDLREGFVQVMRRKESQKEKDRIRFEALDAAARYEVRDLDTPDQPMTMSGAELIKRGLGVTIATRPMAVLYTYKQRD